MSSPPLNCYRECIPFTLIQDHNNDFSWAIMNENCETRNKRACRIATFSKDFHQAVTSACTGLRQAGLGIDILCQNVLNQSTSREPNTKKGKALQVLKQLTINAGHSINRGWVYRKHPKGKRCMIILENW